MKKQSLYLIGLLAVAITALSEFALSVTKEEQWSNYVLSRDTKWKPRQKTPPLKKMYPMKAPYEPKITTCERVKNKIGIKK
jgi:hypothetical protein